VENLLSILLLIFNLFILTILKNLIWINQLFLVMLNLIFSNYIRKYASVLLDKILKIAVNLLQN